MDDTYTFSSSRPRIGVRDWNPEFETVFNGLDSGLSPEWQFQAALKQGILAFPTDRLQANSDCPLNAS